jgi:hypothetical protein
VKHLPADRPSAPHTAAESARNADPLVQLALREIDALQASGAVLTRVVLVYRSGQKVTLTAPNWRGYGTPALPETTP